MMVQKTLDILDYLSNNPNGATLTTIVKYLQFPKTTVYDILKILVKNDYVQYDNSDKKIYCIGAKAYTIGYTYFESSALYKIARPYLHLLANKYGKTTFLSKRLDDRAVSVYKYASSPANISGKIGELKYLHSTSIGKCFLAFDTEAAPLIDTIDLPAKTPYTITDREKLKANIAEIQMRGYSWESREDYLGTSCLAAPIFSNGAMIGTISMVGGYKEDENFSSQGSEIAQFAKLISTQLGQEKNSTIP